MFKSSYFIHLSSVITLGKCPHVKVANINIFRNHFTKESRTCFPPTNVLSYQMQSKQCRFWRMPHTKND